MNERKTTNDNDMKYHRVKWEENGLFRYGTSQTGHAENGSIVVAEAVRPVERRLLADLVCGMSRQRPRALDKCPAFEAGIWSLGCGEYADYLTLNFIKAIELDRRAPGNLARNRLFAVRVEDVWVHYVITKVGKTTSSYEWREFNQSGLVDPEKGTGGRINNKRIGRMLSQELRGDAEAVACDFEKYVKWFGYAYGVDTDKLFIHE